MLDEQLPFSEQSEFVKDAIRKLNNEDFNDILDDDTTGEDIYGDLVNSINEENGYILSQKEAEKGQAKLLEN